MKTISTFAVALILLFSLPGCNQDQEKTEQKQKAQEEVPPSVSGEDTKARIINLSDKEVEELNIQTTRVAREIQNYMVVAPGVAFPAPDHINIVSAPVDGRITSINVTEGDSVSSGSVLITMESLEFGSLVAEYLQAEAEESYQENRLDRIQQLVEKKISSQSELDRARSDYKRASATTNAAYSKLRAVGVPDYDIQKYASHENINPVLNIRAAISGYIDQRFIDLGQSVNAYDKLARVIDKTHVLVKGYVSPQEGQILKTGDSVTITRRKEGSRKMNGVINTINPGLDETNRSVVVNVIVATDDGWPKPGENLRLEIEASSPAEVIAVPVDALTYDGNTPIVFVKQNESTYEKRPLSVSEIRDKYAIVESGLSKNEAIAITQVFSLKALSRYEKFAE